MAEAEHVRIMIVDGSGAVFKAFDPYGNNETGRLGEHTIGRILSAKGNFKEVGTLDGYFVNNLFSIGIKLTDSSGSAIGAIVVSSPPGNAMSSFRQLLNNLLFMGMFVLLIAFALVYYLSQKFTKPIKIVADAARSYAMGNFETRVPADCGQDEYNELASSFNYMADSLEKLETLRSDFIANISHELKTPLTSIGGFLDGVLDGTIPPERQAHYLGLARGEVQRLNRLIGKLLTATQLKSGMQELNVIRLDLCEFIGHAVISFEPVFAEKKLEIEVNLERERIFVMADADALTQILTNLVDNAVKYGVEGGKLEINAAVRGDRAHISVYNTGKGIKKENLPFVFDRFFKSDFSRGMDKNSTGLGLYIVKSILQRMDQSIWADSVEGEYACFTFTLALAKFQQNTVLKS